MSQPKVTITELDGALGVLPPSEGALYALVGVCSSGPTATPLTYARTRDVVAALGSGPLVEAACHYIERYGNAVVVVRTGQTNVGTNDALVQVGTGTSVASVHAGAAPIDDYDLYLVVTTGGTIGTSASIQYSYDGGRNLSPVTALGTDNFFVFPGAGLRVDFAAGTLVAGDTVAVCTHAPLWNSTELGAALDALIASAVTWEIVHVVGSIDATAFDTIETKISGAVAKGKYRAWAGSTRMPNAAESESTYLSSLSGVFGAKSSVLGMLCAGADKMISSAVSGRKYRRPASFSIVARQASVDHEIDIADLNLGTLVGVQITDANGNPDEHDESTNPGLDDARFTVLRSVDGVPGVYVNRPRIFSVSNSDFQLMPHRRVLNLAHGVLRQFFLFRLSKPIQVNKSTGFILESEALEIEAGATAAMRSSLLAKPKASGVQFILSRTDNLLSTKTMTGSARVIPLAYPEFINLDVGFKNPALQIVQV